jgi:hypothetical protein
MIAQSSHMQAHEHDEETMTLTAQFQNGAVYAATGVPRHIYDNFRQSSSPGAAWHSMIKGKYPVTLVSPGATASGKLSRKRY